MRALITATEVGSLSRPCYADEAILVALIQEAEREDIKPRIGDALFLALKDGTEASLSDKYKRLLNGGSWTDKSGSTRYLDGLKTALAYFVYARVVRDGNITSTRYGSRIKSDDNSLEAETEERQRQYRQAFSSADALLVDCLALINEYPEDYNIVTSASLKSNRTKFKVVGGECPHQDGRRSSSPTIIAGKEGASAYEIAVSHGYRGTEAEWLVSLHGADGESLYDILKNEGYFSGSYSEFVTYMTTSFNSLSTLESSTRATLTQATSVVASTLEAKRLAEVATNSVRETEASVASEEALRVSAEKKRVTAEKMRALNEDARQKEETKRSTAESGRSSAEQTRVNNEDVRMANEQTRQQNETARQATIAALGTRVKTKSVTIENRTLAGEDISLDATSDSDDQDILNIGGSMTGSSILRNVADPKQSQDAATKAYVDRLNTEMHTKELLLDNQTTEDEYITLYAESDADGRDVLNIVGSVGDIAIVRNVATPMLGNDAVNLALLDDRYSYLGLRKKGTSKKLADLAVGDRVFVYGYDKNVPPQSTTRLALIKAVMEWGNMNLASAKSWVENIPNSGTLTVVKAEHAYDDKLEDCISYDINGQSTDSFFKCTIPFRSPNIETDEANIAELQRKDRIFVANIEDDIYDRVAAHNNYSEIIIISDDGENIDAKIFPVSQGSGAWMYEWQEQYRIINDDIEDFEGDTWNEFLSWADSHSTAILSEADATARYTKILTYNSTQYTADEVTIANNKVVNLGANVEIVHIPFASGMNWNILRVSGGSAERTLRVWYGDMDAEVTIPKYKSVDLLVHTFDEATLLVHPLYSDTFQYDTSIGTSSNAPTSSAVKTYVDGLVGNINTILTRIVG